MMQINTLSPAPNSKKSRRRVGRGKGSGLGKTSGRGENGQLKHSGGGKGPLFEGGQMPLMLRLPKRGFVSPFKKQYTVVNVQDLNKFEANTTVDAKVLLEKGIINKIAKDGLKILGNGELNVALTVKANKFTETATNKIKKAGGTVEEA